MAGGDDEAGKHAARLAYYGFLSLFPLLLVFATLLARALAHDPQLREAIIDAAMAQFPVLGTQIEGSIRAIEGSGVGLVVGILGTLWGGLGIAQSAARLPGPRRGSPRSARRQPARPANAVSSTTVARFSAASAGAGSTRCTAMLCSVSTATPTTSGGFPC